MSPQPIATPVRRASSTNGSEFTPGAAGITLRSRLANSPYYSAEAVSELDVVAPFDDGTAKTTSNNSEPHRPMGLRVRQESYQWSRSDVSDLVFLRYVIKSATPLTGVCVGLYAEMTSVDKNASATWPPTGAFSKSWL